jgi:hypothetical protein
MCEREENSATKPNVFTSAPVANIKSDLNYSEFIMK